MNILLINHYAGSPQHGMEYRPYYLAREWVRAGHKVHIIASSESHVRSHSPTLNNQNRLDETIDGIDYTWYRTPPYSGNGIGRVWNIAAFFMRLFRESKIIADTFKPDVVIASSTYPMDIWPAHRIAKLAKAKLIFEVHDLWPLSPMELGGMSKWHPFIMLVQQAENYAYRHADTVVSMLPKVREYMESRGMASHKLHIMPNGFDPSEWNNQGVDIQEDIAQRIKLSRSTGAFIVGYAGSHGKPNSLDVFFDAAKYLGKKNIIFLLVGNGHEKPRLQNRKKNERISNIYMFDSIKKEQIPALLSLFDTAYLGAPKSPLYRFGVSPNKLLDYMMAKIPVIYAIEAGNDPVAEAGCGLSIDAEDPNALVEAVLQMVAMPKKERQKMGEQGRIYAEKYYAYPVLAQNFLKIIS